MERGSDKRDGRDLVNQTDQYLDRRTFLGATGAAGLTSVAGCSALGGGGSGGPIKIGAVYMLSGIAEALGQASLAGAKLGVKQINKAGGIMGRDVELISRDHAGSASKANQHFKDLVQSEGVDAMIGLTSSGVTLGTAPTVAQLGVPLMLTDIGTPYITEPNTEKYGSFYKDEGGKAAFKKNIFRTTANTTINTYAMAKLAKEKLDGIERVATVGPDYAYGHQCWDYFKAFSEGLGADYEYVAAEFPKLGSSDMTPQINSVMNADPDLVVTSFWAGDAVTFAQQAASQGLFEQSVDVFDTLGADPTVFKSLGNSMPEGYHYSSWYWHSSFDNKENEQFLKDYWNEYKDDSDTINIPSFTGPSTTSALWLLKRAMESAQSTSPADVIGELEGIEYTGPRGTWKIDPDTHQASAPTSIGQTKRSDADGNDGAGPGVPYDGVGLDPAYSYSLDRSTAKKLLSGSGLPPGV